MRGAARILAALVSGVVFGLGLAVSGMMNPAKVLGFLDFAGDWDPTLALVMGGALLVAVPAFRLAPGRRRPLFSREFQFPGKSGIDPRLVWGSALFGLGWGLVGFCPGPAVAALSSGLVPVFVFLGAMLAGMFLYERMLGGGSGKPGQRPMT